MCAKKNPGDRAGSTGAYQLTESFQSEEYRIRAERATTLCMAIADCDQRDAEKILEAALMDMTAGSPFPPLDGIADEANFWASTASLVEQKNYIVAIYRALPPAEQTAFRRFIDRGDA